MESKGNANFWFISGLVWGCLFGVAGSFFVYQAAGGAKVIWCATDDQGGCLREWLGALGGWVAVVVAVPTILYLREQISTQQYQAKQSEIQHKQTLLASRTPIHALAKRTVDECGRALADLQWIRQYLEPSSYTPMDDHFGTPGPNDYFAELFDSLSERLKSQTFDEFEKIIGSDGGLISREKAIEKLRGFIAFAKRAPNISPTCRKEEYRNIFKSDGFMATGSAYFYLLDCRAVATNFMMPGEMTSMWQPEAIPTQSK
ncbi:hypothetical protein [Rhizobium skierniewicense]|uniref:hypothetical protein n=1 Tax=Rhizobium skierniewicense TaxID=984260 RepID=UPI001574E245|nr:hypothetical protein [Rhizobium skierniewicense]NTF32283.1 hypothetical protein [Rhizobium skierniewicense]